MAKGEYAHIYSREVVTHGLLSWDWSPDRFSGTRDPRLQMKDNNEARAYNEAVGKVERYDFNFILSELNNVCTFFFIMNHDSHVNDSCQDPWANLHGYHGRDLRKSKEGISPMSYQWSAERSSQDYIPPPPPIDSPDVIYRRSEHGL